MADDLDDLFGLIQALRRDHEEHKVLTANMLRVGPVSDRDHAKGIRVEHGADGSPDKSPWVQPAERSGVERDLPRLGEQVVVVAPYGDPEQGITLPFGHSDGKPNPAADADETIVFNRDGCKISVKGGKIMLEAAEIALKVGGVSYTLGSSGHTLVGGKVKHEGLNIGSDHKHGGVLAGGSRTSGPGD